MELAIGCLVDVIHAFTVQNSAYINRAVNLYMQMLLAKVQYSARLEYVVCTKLNVQAVYSSLFVSGLFKHACVLVCAGRTDQLCLQAVTDSSAASTPQTQEGLHTFSSTLQHSRYWHTW